MRLSFNFHPGPLPLQMYQKNPVRYEYVLTKKEKDLRLVLRALAEWGKTYYPGTEVFKPHG